MKVHSPRVLARPAGVPGVVFGGENVGVPGEGDSVATPFSLEGDRSVWCATFYQGLYYVNPNPWLGIRRSNVPNENERRKPLGGGNGEATSSWLSVVSSARHNKYKWVLKDIICRNKIGMKLCWDNVMLM